MEAHKCCVPGCNRTDNLLEFPNPATHLEKFKTWISFIGVRPPDDCKNIYQVYKKKRMCKLHFTPIVYKNRNGERQVLYAAPDKYRPGMQKKEVKKIILLNYKPESSTEKNINSTLTASPNYTSTATQRIIRKRNSNTPKLKQTVKKPLLDINIPVPPESLYKTSRRSPRILRKRNFITQKNVQIKDNTQADIVNPESVSPVGKENSKKLRLIETDTEEDKADSDEDYEVEYLDSEMDDHDTDMEKTETEENVLHEIEYLDMDKLESEDNHEITTNNCIEDTTFINSVPEPLLKPPPQETTNNFTQKIVEENPICTNQISIAEEKNVTVTNVEYDMDIGNTIKIANKESISSQPNEIIQPAPKYAPVLEVNGENGLISIKLAKSESITESLKKCTKENQPTQKFNQPLTITQEKQPITIKKLDSNTLQEFMTKHNLKPIHAKTPLHKQLSATMAQVQNERIGKVPLEIKSPHLQKQLAAITSQTSTDINSKNTNVYVLDSKGSVLIKEQLANKDTLTDQKSVAIEPKGSLPAPIPQNKNATAPQSSFNNFSNQIAQSSPKNSALFNELNKAKELITRLKIRQAKLKSRLKQERNIWTNSYFLKVNDKMERIPRIITTIQMRNSLKGSKGRRFTVEEKKVAQSLREQCPSAYKFMHKMGFILPDIKCLRKVNFKGAIESAVDRNDAMIKLKAKVDSMPVEHRLCTLLFDEKMINPPNRKNHVVTAIGSEGEETEVTFLADHALIFMVKGIVDQYHEPVSYTYSFGPTNGADLATQIKSVITDLQSIGYIVLATICDHADNNKMAIEILINEARCDSFLTGKTRVSQNVFKVNNEEIIPLYDPPHLLKGIRNNLISKKLTYVMNGQTKAAQWKHLEMLLSENPECNGERLIAKLTMSHVYPTKQGISRVKFASQIFSQKIATYMGYLAEKDILPPESRDTADIILFFDQLFDSLNGEPTAKHKNKPLLSAVKPNSVHHKTWIDAIKILKTMKFVNNGAVITVSDIDCWMWTLEGYRLLLQKIFLEHNVKDVWMRNLNQDDLEILFRTEINPPAVNTRNGTRPRNKKTVKKPGRFPGEVVTQKVIKAISRINRQESSD